MGGGNFEADFRLRSEENLSQFFLDPDCFTTETR